jgi:HlyD family secretion protein
VDTAEVHRPDLTSTLPGGPFRLVAAALALPLVMLAGGCGQPTTVRVVKGTVQSSLDATGSLQYLDGEKLGFPVAGKLVSLDVKLGDQVVPGQPLAAIDNTAQRESLRKAQDGVKREQAALDRILYANNMDSAYDDLAAARKQLTAALRTANELEESDSAAIDEVQRELAFDRKNLTLRQQQFNQANTDCPGGTTPPVVSTGGDDPCGRYQSALDSLQSAKRQIITDENSIDSARHRRDLDRATSRTSINSARQAVTSAGNTKDLQGTDRTQLIAGQRAIVDAVQADVVLAQKAFDATIIHAPFHGRVGGINGKIGQFLHAGTAQPAVATGPAATDPGATDADAADPAQSSDVSGPKTTSAVNGPGGDSFIVLKDVNSYQVSAPYSSADAARMQPGQAANVTFDEIPGLTRKGTVSSITPSDPNATNTNYIVKVALTEVDPRLRDGMTAETHVVTGAVNNALVVPTAAVHRTGQSGTVSVLQPDGSPRNVPVELGVTGPDTTQVVSGVRPGDQVVVSGT